jgi:phage-related tail protein
MSTKKETERATTEYDAKRELRIEFSEQGHAVERVLDETRNNIRRTVDEAKREIPRNTQAINDYQEHTLQASREIVDSYLESQKEIIQSFQSTWVPYIENIYGAFWNNWTSPRRAAEIYARTISNFADNIVATTRIANNTLFSNIDAYKTFVQREKEDVKEFSRIAANTARMFENTSREFRK